MNKMFCVWGLSFITMVGALSAQSAITDVFFHHGKQRDRLVWYFSDAFRMQRTDTVRDNLHITQLTLNDIIFDDSTVRTKALAKHFDDYFSIRVQLTHGHLRYTITYDPKNIALSLDQTRNIRGMPMLALTLQRLVTPARVPGTFTVFIDAGHGGLQTGAQANRVTEKTSTLRYAKALRDCLKEKGYQVLMTRTHDQGVDLDKRTSKANMAEADVFISLHHNFSPTNSEMRGIQIFYTHDESRTLAEHMRTALHGTVLGGNAVGDIAIKRAVAQVTYGTEMPAVLIELGYLSNQHDAAWIVQPASIVTIVQRLCQALDSFVAGTIGR